jgi:hypothetical protein
MRDLLYLLKCIASRTSQPDRPTYAPHRLTCEGHALALLLHTQSIGCDLSLAAAMIVPIDMADSSHQALSSMPTLLNERRFSIAASTRYIYTLFKLRHVQAANRRSHHQLQIQSTRNQIPQRQLRPLSSNILTWSSKHKSALSSRSCYPLRRLWLRRVFGCLRVRTRILCVVVIVIPQPFKYHA